MKLSIGDTIEYKLWGDKQTRTATVENIEICREGLKEGRSVKNCDIEKHNNGVLDLDDGHWCYFYQVKDVKNN